MAAKKAERAQHTQAEKLKALLKSMGIHSERDLDKALEKALDGLAIGLHVAPIVRLLPEQQPLVILKAGSQNVKN